ncbi:mandelate racemase/muconate lactonizing enzyme family protein [Gryllotalpicola reticulitermitis]|uniref:Mandelate racemase/muconate lactonizing enzyme family protein n=1 Tax=Gryllotalpicola reticulitermitis TaxID=1184153 RepID=A0ABV8Q6T7_9MICO
MSGEASGSTTTITGFEIFECDLGWRYISFLKLTASNGVVGWSEFNEPFGAPGLGAVIGALRGRILGADPRNINEIVGTLVALLSPSPGGVNREAIGAIENALFDLKARLLDVSVAELLGGALRTRIPMYWSHCGNYRQGGLAAVVGAPQLTSYADVTELGREVVSRGFHGLKTNVITFDDEEVGGRPFGWARHPSASGRDYDDRMLDQTVSTLAAFRDGVGPQLRIHLDVNYNYLVDGYRRVATAVAPYQLTWLELDGVEPGALAQLRQYSSTPIASGESLFGAQQYLPYFEARALDVAIVDVIWNGIGEATRIAQLAGTFGASVAPHNFYGPLATAMSAHFSAVAPNLAELELDVDGVPWRDELVTTPPRVVDGFLEVPDGPGWGVEPIEDVIRAHPRHAA